MNDGASDGQGEVDPEDNADYGQLIEYGLYDHYHNSQPDLVIAKPSYCSLLGDAGNQVEMQTSAHPATTQTMLPTGLRLMASPLSASQTDQIASHPSLAPLHNALNLTTLLRVEGFVYLPAGFPPRRRLIRFHAGIDRQGEVCTMQSAVRALIRLPPRQILPTYARSNA